MKLFSVIETVMVRLSALPGLGFLSRYVTEYHGHVGKLQHKVSGYQGYVRTVRQAGADVAEVGRGSKREEPSDDEEQIEEYDDDDDESYMQT
jgi:hypothetical protein